MTRRFSPLSLALTLSMLALVACDESSIPTDPGEPASSTATVAVSYSAQELGIFAEIAARATAINASGQVVGYTFDPDDTFRGFIWKDGVRTRLGTLGGSHTRAMDINDAGQVVGTSENTKGKMRAFRWTNGTMTGLGTLGGSESFAFGINSQGHVVGQSRLAGTTHTHAFLVKNGVMSDLGTLGGANSSAMDINDAGQVVGWSETDTGGRHPFLWENGVMKDLFPPGSTSTGTAYAINGKGAVVGERNNRAFRWQNGVISGLGLGGRGPSVATGIRGGRIVGIFEDGGAFVLADGEVTLLPLLGDPRASAAFAVNGAGVIVGEMTTELDGYHHVMMWTPQ